MSWLEDLEYEHEYVCPDGHESVYKCKNSEAPPEELECGHCTLLAQRVGFKPQPPVGKLIVQFEKNGRIGYAVTTGGNTTYVSKTKLDYMKTGTNKSAFSKEYKQHTQDKMENEFGAYRKQLESNATVSSATKKDSEI